MVIAFVLGVITAFVSSAIFSTILMMIVKFE
jgi:hypothetical protein